MICPKCQNLESKVIDSRLTNKNTAIRRRRECEKCSFRFSTIERVRVADLIVKKKDQSREPYDRAKIEEGIWKAAQKRLIAKKQIDDMVSKLEEKWNQQAEIDSQLLGADIMEELKKIDEVTYIRFASVYRSFKDLDSFLTEAQKLKNNNSI